MPVGGQKKLDAMSYYSGRDVSPDKKFNKGLALAVADIAGPGKIRMVVNVAQGAVIAGTALKSSVAKAKARPKGTPKEMKKAKPNGTFARVLHNREVRIREKKKKR